MVLSNDWNFVSLNIHLCGICLLITPYDLEFSRYKNNLSKYLENDFFIDTGKRLVN